MPISSPLRTTLTNIFVDFHKQDLTEHIKGPNYYVTYVNSSFCVFDKVKAGVFHETLNKLDLALQFICKKEKNGVLSFLDQLIHIVLSVYQKLNFTGLYTHWDSFCYCAHFLSSIKLQWEDQ